MKPALLVIDMQKKYRGRSQACAASMDEAAKNTVWAIDLFERRKLPVIHIVHNGGGPEALESEDFWELDSIAGRDRKQIIVKTRGSAFIGTDLDKRLREAGVDMLVLCGFAAEYCVLSTARAAEDSGWRLALLHECLASPQPENIPFVERISETVSCGALEGFLG
jgi:nicotinamidase-related amidase